MVAPPKNQNDPEEGDEKEKKIEGKKEPNTKAEEREKQGSEEETLPSFMSSEKLEGVVGAEVEQADVEDDFEEIVDDDEDDYEDIVDEDEEVEDALGGEKKVEDVLDGEKEVPVVVIAENSYGHEITFPEENLNKKDEKSEANQSFIELSNHSFQDNLINFAQDEKEKEIKPGKRTFLHNLHPCNICGKILNRPFTLRKHMMKHTGQKVPLYPCTECDKKFKRPNVLRIHMVKHTGIKELSCNMCDLKYTSMKYLFKHERYHLGVCPYKCNQCGASFKSNKGLVRHGSLVHDVPENQDCDLCDSKFESYVALAKHKKSEHGVKQPFVCDICGVGVSKNEYLKRHIILLHTDPAQLKCEECGMMFTRKKHLLKHQFEHAKANGTLTPEQLEEKLTPKSEPRVCELCGKSLSCALTLKRHLRRHDVDRVKDMHPCDERCGKIYTEKRHLDDHVNIVHQRLKNYPCSKCGKLFGRKTNLADHIKRKHEKRVKVETH